MPTSLVVQREISRLQIPSFYPHPLLRGGHRQTVAGVYWPKVRVPYSAVQHVVALDDGDHIVLHDDRPDDWREGDRCALLIHGLGGSYLSPYLVRLVQKLNVRGVRTFRMDMRGAGAASSLASGPGHAGRSGDVAASLNQIAWRCPGSPVTAVGFSLGGNLVLKLVGELGSRTCGGLDSAMAAAPPIDLLECSRNIGRGSNKLYDRAFVRALLRILRQTQRAASARVPISLSRRPRSLQEFDDRVTAPLGGFADAQDYYARSSSGPLLKNVCVPTLILTAGDDPLIPRVIFDRHARSAAIQFHSEPFGGHVGFIGRRATDPDRFWLDWRVIEWIEHVARAAINHEM